MIGDFHLTMLTTSIALMKLLHFLVIKGDDLKDRLSYLEEELKFKLEVFNKTSQTFLSTSPPCTTRCWTKSSSRRWPAPRWTLARWTWGSRVSTSTGWRWRWTSSGAPTMTSWRWLERQETDTHTQKDQLWNRTLTHKVTWEQLEGEYKERLAKLELELSLLINQQSSLEDEGQIMWVATIMGNADHNYDM